MTTLLMVILCVSPVSAVIMIRNQCKLEKIIKANSDTVDRLESMLNVSKKSNSNPTILDISLDD